MTSQFQSRTLPIVGMSCAACARNVETKLRSQPGISNVSVNFSNNTAYLEFNPAVINLMHLQSELHSIGYKLIIEEEDVSSKTDAHNQERFLTLRKKLVVAVIFTLPVFVISMFWHNTAGWLNYFLLILTLPVIVFSGSEFYVIAWRQAKHRMANMDTLVALGTGSAFLFSLIVTFFPGVFAMQGHDAHVYYESAAVIITFVLAGRLLEEKARAKASAAIRELISLQPKTVTVLRNGREESISVRFVLPGDVVLIKPGERVPVDGEVLEGESNIDESMISGEPIPVNKTKGSGVFAGTLNQHGIINIRALKVGGETLLAQIIAMVERAQATKAPIQRLADKIAGIFVPVVLILALATFLVWITFGPEPGINLAFIASLSVLIIACPCALGLATPTALVAGLGKAAGMGILVRDAATLETIHRINFMVIDKTGTLTTGRPEIVSSWYDESMNLKAINALVHAIEARSTHPLAGAIVRHIKEASTPSIEFKSYANVSGQGIVARIHDEKYWIGNQSLCGSFKITVPEAALKFLHNAENDGNSIMLFGNTRQLLAAFAANDRLKESALPAIEQINDMGIETMLLSGDQPKAVESVARALGIKHFKSRVLPSEKHLVIEELQQKGKVVAMVGDGINDAAALAKADVGIAMASGSDIAIECSGITLMNSDPLSIMNALKITRQTVKIIKQNLFWAFFYNIAALPIAAGILYPFTGFLLNPMVAAAAMSLSSITVVANSLRLNCLQMVER